MSTAGGPPGFSSKPSRSPPPGFSTDNAPPGLTRPSATQKNHQISENWGDSDDRWDESNDAWS